MANLSPFRAALPQLNRIKSTTSFFKDVKNDFRGYMERGFYRQDDHESFYIHRVRTKFRSYTGFVAFTDVNDYIKNKVKKHENTIKTKEDHVSGLYAARQALIKPVLLTYPNVMEIDTLTNRLTFSLKPMMEFNYEDEHHTFWRVDQPEYIEQYRELFKKKVKASYIADGHHRSHTSIQNYENSRRENPNHNGTEPYNFVFTEYFPVSELEVHNYNRLLTTLNGMPPQEFLRRLQTVFIVEASDKAVKPVMPLHLGLYLVGEWYNLTVRPEYLEGHTTLAERLDVQIFNEAILQDILGVVDARLYPGIAYLEGPKGTSALVKAVDEGDAVAAFNLYPMPLEHLVTLAKENAVLPPKSTWFFPRLRSGFMAQLFS